VRGLGPRLAKELVREPVTKEPAPIWRAGRPRLVPCEG
jgi:hypothetical protein